MDQRGNGHWYLALASSHHGPLGRDRGQSVTCGACGRSSESPKRVGWGRKSQAACVRAGRPGSGPPSSASSQVCDFGSAAHPLRDFSSARGKQRQWQQQRELTDHCERPLPPGGPGTPRRLSGGEQAPARVSPTPLQAHLRL